ncbi:multicopper oxidase family protein [Geodermatophilus sp. URMC 64]
MTPDQHTAAPASPSAPDAPAVPEDRGVTRRTFLRVGALGTAAVGFYTARSILEPSLRQRGLWTPDGVFGAASTAWADSIYTEVFPTSPLILEPFTDEITNPKALRPATSMSPAPSLTAQTDLLDNKGKIQSHQIPPTPPGPAFFPTRFEPMLYDVTVQLAEHRFVDQRQDPARPLRVLPITADGKPTNAFGPNGQRVDVDPAVGIALPPSVIFGFNGIFPGPRINAEYGKPVLVRLRNQLNDGDLDIQDFGAPDRTFLIHLHNGHTAPESDGNPHFFGVHYGPDVHGYPPGKYVDNLYLNFPAGNDDAEKQSFFWFHDHRIDHTGANVYKGLVGLYPIYDPKPLGNAGMTDGGDERQGLRLPGVRTDYGDGSFDVEYDVPLALFDVRLDDGVTTHHDIHDQEYPVPGNRAHPEWWGKSFYKHFPNHGFVGDIFTVNGVAYPVMQVKRRKYRLRFLDASIARIYELKLMTSTQGPKSAVSLGLADDELQGQYRIPDGQQCMRFTEIATDGGLLPFAITRDSFELWPAKRREVIVDFAHWMDGKTTSINDVIYLANVMKMPTGRMWSSSTRFSPDPRYKVPLLKFVIAGDAEDNSVLPTAQTPLRPLPTLPANWRDLLSGRHIFEVQRGSAGGELEWLINGKAFDPVVDLKSLKNPAGQQPVAAMKRGPDGALWELRNGGGGWVHPVHLHQEEHRTVMRNGRDVSERPDPGHPDDKAREDLAALDPSESVIVFRRFRDFVGEYVAHCHNLAHEDHAMMFGWSIKP